MTRGGKRLGSGAKSTWKSGATRTIRVPIAIAEEVLMLARDIDCNGSLEQDTKSKVLDLSGISIFQLKGKSFVSLQDLIVSGYEIKPTNLADKLIEEIYKGEFTRGKKDQDYSSRDSRSIGKSARK